MIKTKEIQNYKNYGACISLSNENIELYVTVDCGPRIIYLACSGCENMMFNDVDREISHDVSSLFSEGDKWFIYGGHRLWASPEEFPKTYYPDNEKVVYEYLPNGVILTPAVQKVTGLAYSIVITLDETEPKVSIVHTIKNTNKETCKIAAWGLSVMDAGGTLIVPMNTEDTGFLPNRHISLWPYTKFSDKRMYWGDSYLGLKHDSECEGPIKVSLNNVSGKIAYINHNQAFVKSFLSLYNEDVTYPDFDTNCEFYSCKQFTEVESLSPLYTLKTGDSLTHTEEWTLIKGIKDFKLTEANCKKVAEKIF